MMQEPEEPKPDFLSFVTTSPHACYNSLARSAKKEQLKVARYILLLIGLLTIAWNGYEFSQIDRAVDLEVQKRINSLHAKGLVEDQVEVTQLRNRLARFIQFACGLMVAVGIVFVVLGMMVYAYPLSATILGLVIYVGSIALFGFLSPETLLQGALGKIVFVVALAASVRTAIAWRVTAT